MSNESNTSGGTDVKINPSDEYRAGHREGIRICAQLLAWEYNDRADLLTGSARQAMRDAALIAHNVAIDAPEGSDPARGEWPIKRDTASA